MANNSSARKRVRQNEKHRQSNVTQKSRMRTAIKKVIKAIDTGNAKEATELYGVAQPLIDSLATKGLIHKNKAANLKSKLNKRIKTIG
jgi:small subunit ribosomal protein S20